MATNKRVKRKQTKKKQTQTLKKQYSEKEIKQLYPSERAKEEKRINRNEARKQSRAETKAFFLSQGIPEKLINREKLYNKKVTSYSAADILKIKKQAELEKAGIKYSKKDLSLGWVKLSEKYPSLSIPEQAQKQKQKRAKKEAPKIADNFTFTVKEYLYVGAAEIRGGFRPIRLSDKTVGEIEALINDRINEARNNPDDSNSLYCVYQTYSGTKSNMEHVADVYYKRGYDLTANHVKLDNNQYNKLTVSNKWNKHSFLELVYNCTAQMKNEDVSPFIKEMKRYCERNNLPFMEEIN